jgi:hypothetical protein
MKKILLVDSVPYVVKGSEAEIETLLYEALKASKRGIVCVDLHDIQEIECERGIEIIKETEDGTESFARMYATHRRCRVQSYR